MIFNFKNREKNDVKFGFRILTLAVALVFICSITVTSFAVANAYERYYISDGVNSKRVSSSSLDAAEIVSQSGFVLEEGDELDLSSFKSGEGGIIIINRAGSLKNVLENKRNELEEAVIAKQEKRKSDIKNSLKSVKSFLSGDFTVSVSHDGKTENVSVTEGDTVKEALAKAGIDIGKDDGVSPAADSVIKRSDSIRITRVRYEMRTETVKIEYSVKTVPCADMSLGTEKVVTKGVCGEKTVRSIDKYSNGELVESKIIKETVVKEPIEEVVKVGTAPVDVLSAYAGTTRPISELEVPSSVKLDENGIPVSYKSKVKAKATAYTGDPFTASGRTPMPGHIAVDPKEYPYGTELYIVSADGKYVYGYCIAADTGGFVKMGNTDVDVYMNNEDMCYDWGNRDVIIYVL